MMFRGRLSNAIKPRSLYPLYGAKNRRQIGTSSWSRYSQLLERHPLPTKALTSGILCGAGDASCQLLEKLSPRKYGEEAPTFDAGRTTRFALVGAAVLAPTLHVWYSRLNSLFPGCSMAAVLKRLALDQLGFAPLFIPVFMSSLLVLEGKASDIGTRLKASWADALIANWGLWVPAQVVNFRFVPPIYQVLFANGVGFIWNIILSFLSFKPVEKDKGRGVPIGD